MFLRILNDDDDDDDDEKSSAIVRNDFLPTREVWQSVVRQKIGSAVYCTSHNGKSYNRFHREQEASAARKLKSPFAVFKGWLRKGEVNETERKIHERDKAFVHSFTIFRSSNNSNNSRTGQQDAKMHVQLTSNYTDITSNWT